ncbi:hypothetical protein [Rhodopseudomonas palustris]|uniref:hypothetical protein n=1 Tax=Rhodopseudomonas palustris TaxID=1076 RepID=UPI0016029468
MSGVPPAFVKRATAASMSSVESATCVIPKSLDRLDLFGAVPEPFEVAIMIAF